MSLMCFFPEICLPPYELNLASFIPWQRMARVNIWSFSQQNNRKSAFHNIFLLLPGSCVEIGHGGIFREVSMPEAYQCTPVDLA